MDEKAKETSAVTVQEKREEKEDSHKRTMKLWVRVVAIIGGTAALILLATLIYPMVKFFLSAPEIDLREYVERMGLFGYVFIYIFQVLQVVIAVIPGGVVEFVAGYAYSPWIGLVVCIAGVYTGQFIIFRLVRRFGHRLVEAVADGEKLKRWDFIRNENKLELLTFVFYVIPGIPKDILCYIFPLTSIDERRFLIISIIARIPGAITSVIAADYLYEGDYIPAIIMWGLMMLLSGSTVLITSYIMKKRKNKRENTPNNP